MKRVTPLKDDKREQQEQYDRKSDGRTKQQSRDKDKKKQQQREQREDRW